MPEVRIELPPPHSEIQKQIMEALIAPDGPEEVWIPCGTKFGKTMACSVALAAATPRYPTTQWRWLAPYYSQAVIGYDNLKQILPKSFIRARKSSMSIEIPSIDTTTNFIHAQIIEQIEGHQIHGYVIDEAAKIREEAYYSCRTTVTRTRSIGMGRFVIPSTPLGKNWFYDGCMQAKNEMELAKQFNRKPKSIFLTAPTSANPFISQTVIDSARQRLPERLFRQFYLAEFLDESAVFTGLEKIIFGMEFSLSSGRFALWLDPSASKSSVVIGADWARGNSASADNTVFTAINYEVSPAKVVGIMRLRGLNYTEQLVQLVRFSQKFHDTRMVLHDKTGVGIAIDDQLELTGLVYEGKTFSLQSKGELVCSSITAIEQRRLAIPHCKDLLDELKAYEMSVTKNGYMQFQAPKGKHDDMVCSLLLAWFAARRYTDTDAEFTTLDEISKNKTPLKTFYDELAEEEDDLYGDWIETIKTVGQ